MKNAVFWMLHHVALVRTDVSEEHRFHHQSDKSQRARSNVSVHLLLVTINTPSSPILVTLMMELVRSSETSVLTRGTPRQIPEDGILQLEMFF
jgi:hypothetical protein